jgi:hypothetical protein
VAVNRFWEGVRRLPPQIATRFTTAGAAILAVIAVDVAKRGACTLTIGHTAALTRVSETTVRNALRQARGLGLLTWLTVWRNASNVVRIVSPEWQA